MKTKSLKHSVALYLFLSLYSCNGWAGSGANISICPNGDALKYIEQQRYFDARKLLDKKSKSEDSSTIVILAALDVWGLGRISRPIENESFGDNYSDVIEKLERCNGVGGMGAKLIAAITIYSTMNDKANYDLAEKLFKVVSKQNHPAALLGLAAISHMRGSVKYADTLISKAIDISSELDEYVVGQLFLHGIIFKKDYTKAAYWIEKSARSGNIKAQGEIGYMYAVGIGVEQSREKSRYWLQLQKNNPEYNVDTKNNIVVAPLIGK
jgi:uncharacterized protein